jgi:hypothetical protein
MLLMPFDQATLKCCAGGLFVEVLKARRRRRNPAAAFLKLDARRRPSRDGGQRQHGAKEYRGFQFRQSPHVENSRFPPELPKSMKGL